MLISETLLKKTELCVERLLQSGKEVSFAESCTGGLIAFLFSSIPGASKVLTGSVVTYTNEAKTDLLGVSGREIKTFGAVSKKISHLMAKRLLDTLPSAYMAISVTGYAGSKTSTINKIHAPLEEDGKVYIGLATRSGKTLISEHHFTTELYRYEIQQKAAEKALDIILSEIDNAP